MPTQQISQHDLDRLTQEAIGSIDLADEKLKDKLASSHVGNCPTTTVQHTFDC